MNKSTKLPSEHFSRFDDDQLHALACDLASIHFAKVKQKQLQVNQEVSTLLFDLIDEQERSMVKTIYSLARVITHGCYEIPID